MLYIRREHGGHQEGAGGQQHQIQQSAQQKPVQILVTELLRAPALVKTDSTRKILGFSTYRPLLNGNRWLTGEVW